MISFTLTATSVDVVDSTMKREWRGTELGNQFVKYRTEGVRSGIEKFSVLYEKAP